MHTTKLLAVLFSLAISTAIAQNSIIQDAPGKEHIANAVTAPDKYVGPDGYFVKEHGKWTEYKNGVAAPFAFFDEKGVENGAVVLFDVSRKMYLKIPINGGFVTWSMYNPVQWTILFWVDPA